MKRSLLTIVATAALLFATAASAAAENGLFTRGGESGWGGTDGGRYATSAPLKLSFVHQSAAIDGDHVTITNATWNSVPIAATAGGEQRPSTLLSWIWFFDLEPPAGGWPEGVGTLHVEGQLEGKGADTGTSLNFIGNFNNTSFDGTPPTFDYARINGLAKATASPNVYIETHAHNAESDCGVFYTATPGTTFDSTFPGLPGPYILKHTGVPSGDTLHVTLEAGDCVGNIATRELELKYVSSATSGLQIVSKSGGTLFTNSTSVDAHLFGPPFASEMLVSNEGSFAGATWKPYDWNQPWKITGLGNYTLPRTVYAKYRLADGSETGVFSDEIIYDPLDPVLASAHLRVHGGGKATLRVRAKDRGPSGLGKLQIKRAGSKKVKSYRYRATSRVPSGKKMSVRVVDNAGNASKWKRLP